MSIKKKKKKVPVSSTIIGKTIWHSTCLRIYILQRICQKIKYINDEEIVYAGKAPSWRILSAQNLKIVLFFFFFYKSEF